MEEHVFLKEENILISSTRLCLENKTIAIKSICSIEMSKEQVKPSLLLFSLPVLAILVAMVHPLDQVSVYSTRVGAVLLLIFFVNWILRYLDREEGLVIVTSGGSEMIDKSEVDDIDKVSRSINEAIIFRG